MTHNTITSKADSAMCTDSYVSKSTVSEITCKLTTPELRKRKESVIADLKGQILEKSELPNGTLTDSQVMTTSLTN